MRGRVVATIADWGDMRYALVRWQGLSRQRRHSHAEARIVLVLDGRFDERVGERSYTCGPGTAIYREAEHPHVDEYDGEGAYVSIAIRDAARAGLSFAALGTASHVAQSAALRALGLRIAKEIRRPDAFSHLATEGLALEAAAALGRFAAVERRAPTWLRAAESMVRTDLNTRWTVARLAAELGREPAEVVGAFRRHAGIGVGEYARRARLERAQALLARGGVTMADVALVSGFYDQSHLNRCFRDAFGMTPGEYRLQCKP